MHFSLNNIILYVVRNEDVSAEFDRLDKDGNGVLSPDEVQEVIKTMMGFDNKTAKWMVNTNLYLSFPINFNYHVNKIKTIHIYVNHRWPLN